MKITKEHKKTLIKAVSIAKLNGFQIDESFFTDCDVEDSLFNGMKGYYNVIFDHNFAKCFWNENIFMELSKESEAEEENTKDVDLVETLKDGNHPLAGIFFSHENVRIPMWQYNLSQMVLSEDPLMYIKHTLVESGLW